MQGTFPLISTKIIAINRELLDTSASLVENSFIMHLYLRVLLDDRKVCNKSELSLSVASDHVPLSEEGRQGRQQGSSTTNFLVQMEHKMVEKPRWDKTRSWQ